MTELNTLRGSSDRAWQWGLGAASLAAVAIIWQGIALELKSLLLPTFTSTLAASVRLAADGQLWEALWVSNQAAALGFICAAVAGIAIGLVTGRWRLAEKMFDPYLNILLAVPKAALIPVLIMATGLGLLSRVLVVFSFSVVSIAVNTRAGLRLVDRNWVEMAHSFGANEVQLWRKVLLPGALPRHHCRTAPGSDSIGLRDDHGRTAAARARRRAVDPDLRGHLRGCQSLLDDALFVVAEAVLLTQALNWVERRAFAHIGQAVVE